LPSSGKCSSQHVAGVAWVFGIKNRILVLGCEREEDSRASWHCAVVVRRNRANPMIILVRVCSHRIKAREPIQNAVMTAESRNYLAQASASRAC
jgi:hypothetical protein